MAPMSWPEASFICSTFDVPTAGLSGSRLRTGVMLTNYQAAANRALWLE